MIWFWRTLGLLWVLFAVGQLLHYRLWQRAAREKERMENRP